LLGWVRAGGDRHLAERGDFWVGGWGKRGVVIWVDGLCGGVLAILSHRDSHSDGDGACATALVADFSGDFEAKRRVDGVFAARSWVGGGGS